MADGPGKYDDACTVAREMTRAQGIVLIVLDGNQGNGFSIQGYDRDLLMLRLPALLRIVAAELEGDHS